MSDGKEVKLRTNPPRNCQYLTWCNDCEEAVPHEEGSCAGCASLDLVYFVKESDHDRIVAELRAEVERLKSKDSELIKCLQDLTGANNQVNPHLGVAAGVALMKAELTDSNKIIATQARVIEIAKRVLHNAGLRPPDGGTPTVETICEDLSDAMTEIAAIEKEGAKDE